MSDSVQTHRRQPTKLPGPWDSPGKNTGVGCHFLLQSMKVKSESEVAQSYPTLSDPMDSSLPGSSISGIFQAKSTGVGCHCLLPKCFSLHQNLFCSSCLFILKTREEQCYFKNCLVGKLSSKRQKYLRLKILFTV